MKPTFAILGAGLSGLLIAKRLQTLNYKVFVIEARNRIGGRIFTDTSSLETPIEMGATWFGHQHTELLNLLKELDLGYFEQYMNGTALFEAFSMAPPQEFKIPQDIPSYRVVGGTAQILEHLSKDLKHDQLFLNQIVMDIDFSTEKVQLKTNNQTFHADCVISTIPPSLFAHSINCTPSLPEDFSDVARFTHTWMQDSTKVAVVYKKSFWREKSYSGIVFSQVGPLTEFYDQSDVSNTRFALCGFINGGFSYLTKEERKEKVIAQLIKLFGTVAADFETFSETVWSDEPFTKHKKQVN
ncbi:MAG: NAD(P)-binding protein [Bacteroidetes bacterium]|nr:NAD(P)-binding protein [Bacteroidota bacterium]